MMINYIIIGAGLTGCVLAERLASSGENVLLIEKKQHIGGTCYDCYDSNGILIQKYGPHIFNTDDQRIWNYMEQFTEFLLYHHRVLGIVEGKKVPIPFNLESLHTVFPGTYAMKLERELLKKYGMNTKIPIMSLQNQEDPELKFLANYIYENVFLQYTRKQWGMIPEEVGSVAMARVPFYISRDDRYFQNCYQGIPKEGYTKMFKNMICHPKIHLLMNTDCHEMIKMNLETHSIDFMGEPFLGNLICTAPLDSMFYYVYGKLPYRTIDFVFETYDREYYQECSVVNYPNNYDFTRITEFKHMTEQIHHKTTIVKEFPKQYDCECESMDPYYPIPKKENETLYNKYLDLANRFPNLVLAGRLADYKYYTMAETVGNALSTFENLYSNQVLNI